MIIIITVSMLMHPHPVWWSDCSGCPSRNCPYALSLPRQMRLGIDWHCWARMAWFRWSPICSVTPLGFRPIGRGWRCWVVRPCGLFRIILWSFPRLRLSPNGDFGLPSGGWISFFFTVSVFDKGMCSPLTIMSCISYWRFHSLVWLHNLHVD